MLSGVWRVVVPGVSKHSPFTIRLAAQDVGVLEIADLLVQGAGLLYTRDTLVEENADNVVVTGEGDIAENLDIAATGQPMVVKELKGLEIQGLMDIELIAKKGRTVICGVELIESKGGN